MKLHKHTFMSPLCGSISSQELFPDTNGAFDVCPTGMCNLYDSGPELADFLQKNSQDLTDCLPDNLKEAVLKITFGDYGMQGGKMYLYTYAWTEELMTDAGLELLADWISGQMSDGWGENLEQDDWKVEDVRRKFTVFDEYTFEFEEDEELCRVFYYVSPWNSEDFFVNLMEITEDELDIKIEPKVQVAFASCELLEDGRYFVKNLLQFDDAEDIVTWLRDSNRTDTTEPMCKFIEERAPFGCAVKHYIVSEGDGTYSLIRFKIGVKDYDRQIFTIFEEDSESGTVTWTPYSFDDEDTFKKEMLK